MTAISITRLLVVLGMSSLSSLAYSDYRAMLMASFTGTLVYRFYTSNERTFSSFSSFICSRVFRSSLVLVSMFVPSKLSLW